MKYLLAIFFIFFYLLGHSQIDYQEAKKQLITRNQRPPQDTIIPPLWVGEVRTKVSNDTPYLYICISKINPKKWELVKGQGSTGTGLINPMTTQGDIIIGGTSGTPTRLSRGSNRQVLQMNGTNLEWDSTSIYRPEDFGAIGNNVVDDGPAFQSMLNYIGSTGGQIYLDGKKTYFIGTPINFPRANGESILVIEGNGAQMRGNLIFQDTITSNASALINVNRRKIIRNIAFRALTFETGSAIILRGTYGSLIENCRFTNYDTALIVRFGLHTKSRNNMFAGNKVSILFGYGDWADAGIATSQSNGSVSEGDRIYGTNNDGVGILVEASSDIHVKNSIIEGNALKHAILFDSKSATVVKDFTLDGLHLEVLGKTKSYALYFKTSAGIVRLSNIFNLYTDTVAIQSYAGITRAYISGLGSNTLRYGTIGASNSVTWDFNNMDNFSEATHMLTSSTSPFTTSNSAVINVYNDRTGIGTTPVNMTSSNGRRITASFNAIEITGPVWFPTDNTYNIGNTSSNRPANMYLSNSVFVSNGGFRWTGKAGFISSDSGTIRMIQDTNDPSVGAFGLAYGATSKRPVSPRAGDIRGNFDSLSVGAGLEVYMNSIWKIIASSNQVKDSSNAIRSWANAKFLNNDLIGSATLDFGSVAAGAKEDLTITVTGASIGDKVILGAPNLPTNGSYSAVVTATNTVTIRFTNNDLTAPIDPDSGTFKVKVLK